MNDDAAVPMPGHAYVPGVNARHADGAFDVIRQTAADCGDLTALGDSLAWRAGLDYYRQGFFWECHEVLEAVWMACPPNAAERHFVQAIIQMANARLKLAMHRPGAAARLCRHAGELLREAGLQGRAVLLGTGFEFAEDELRLLARDIEAAQPTGDSDRKYNA